jgi:hypothetical protein
MCDNSSLGQTDTEVRLPESFFGHIAQCVRGGYAGDFSHGCAGFVGQDRAGSDAFAL